jgi:DisA bacterial checkpoint controller nucleotide-binding
VIARDLTILGFGAKIDCRYDPDKTIRVSEPLEDSQPEEKTISKLDGTRHQSAARFVRDNKDSIAVVASQDGVVSFIAWDKEAGLISVTRHAEWQLR